jgi:prepilin-type N-terminal cleavage/methylation domain-containing protein
VRWAQNFRTSRRAGFTLVEVMLAFVVIAVVIVGAARAVAQSARAESRANREHTAALLAAQVLGAIEAAGEPLAAGPSGTFAEAGFPQFAWRVESRPAPAKGLTEVAVVVEWPEGTYRIVRWLRER